MHESPFIILIINLFSHHYAFCVKMANKIYTNQRLALGLNFKD